MAPLAVLVLMLGAADAHARGRADLSVLRATATPQGTTALYLDLRVRNRGSRRAPASTVASTLVIALPPRLRVPALRAGGSARVRGWVALPPLPTGVPLRAVVCADAGRRVRERDEKNNCAPTTPFTLPVVAAPVTVPVPAAEPTPAPTPELTPTPTAEPTAAPTAQPTPTPTPTPTPAPTPGPYEPDPAFGEGGRFAVAIGQVSAGAMADLLDDGSGGTLLVGSAIAGDDEVLTIVRLLPDGERDPTFAAGEARVKLPIPWDSALGAARLTTGHVVVAIERGTTQGALVKVKPDGSLDPTFGDGGVLTTGSFPGFPPPLAADALDRIVTAERNQNGGVVLRRRTATGAADTGFGNQGTVTVPAGAGAEEIEITPGGSAVTVLGGVTYDSSALLRFTEAGEPDEDFGTDGRIDTPCKGPGMDVAPDGRILIGCGREVEQRTSDGSRDTGFSGDGFAYFGGITVNDIAYDPFLRPLVAVDGATPYGSRVLRLLVSGEPDLTWAGTADPGVNRSWPRLLPQADGRVRIAGRSTPIDGERIEVEAPRVSRLTAGGELDATFGEDGRTLVRLGHVATAWPLDVVAGPEGARMFGAAHFGEDRDLVVAAVTENGALDATWGDGGIARFGGRSHPIDAVATGSGGVAVLAGDLDSNEPFVTRLDGEGDVAATAGVMPPGMTYFGATGFARTAAGELIVAGAATNGHSGGIAVGRLDEDGKPDATFGTAGWVVLPYPASSYVTVHDPAPAPDGSLDLVLDGLNGNDGGWIVRLGATGEPVETFGPGGVAYLGDTVDPAAAVRTGAGRVVVAAGVYEDARLLALGPTGASDLTFATATFQDASPLALTADAAGRLIVSGAHGPDGPRPFVARAGASGAPDEAFGPGGVAVTPAPGTHSPYMITGALPQPDGRVLAGGPAHVTQFRMAMYALAPG